MNGVYAKGVHTFMAIKKEYLEYLDDLAENVTIDDAEFELAMRKALPELLREVKSLQWEKNILRRLAEKYATSTSYSTRANTHIDIGARAREVLKVIDEEKSTHEPTIKRKIVH